MVQFIASIFTSFIFLLPHISWGRVLSDDISITSKQVFSLSEFCREMVSHPTPLIEVQAIDKVDCMGKKIRPHDFCMIKMKEDPYYLRAYAHSERIECISGKKVIFKYLCKKASKVCSQDARTNCMELKDKLAYRLELVHSSLIKKDQQRQLNCFYDLPVKTQ